MAKGSDPFDQSKPVKPGYIRIKGFMDVAAYNDALFLEYTKDKPDWQFILNLTPGHQNPVHREAHFNAEHFENSVIAMEWNRFVESRRV